MLKKSNINLSRLRQAILNDKLPARTTTPSKILESAVLVPFVTFEDRLCLIYTKRSPQLVSHRGDVSFPGGLFEPDDEDLTTTALRETHEEIGLPPASIEVLGYLKPVYNMPRTVCVQPVVGYASDFNPNDLRLNPDEVEHVYAADVEKLSSMFRYTRFRDPKKPSFSTVLPVYYGCETRERIWGMTAIITQTLLNSLHPELN